jgi:Na+/proline symporter/nitrogen-specific signal transduction histidine kinase
MMTFETTSLLLVAGAYLLLFYGVAWLTERGRIPQRLLNHPAVYVLSLSLIVNSWAFYTVYISAADRGYGYNSYYIGYAAAFLFAPILLKPVLQITRTYHLSSLPDVFAFRFRSQWAGILSSIIILICIFPLIALQIYNVAETTRILAPAADTKLLAFLYCCIVAFFTLRFGTRDVTGRERNDSIVMALAFEAVVKIVLLTLAGGFAIFGVFGGVEELQAWLDTAPLHDTRLNQPYLQNSQNLLVLLFFTAAIAMPHMFHVVFHENRNTRHLETASWGMPLYMLFASLPVLPVLWASTYLGNESRHHFSLLFLGTLSDNGWFTLLMYMGGLAATCGMVIVLATSVSSLCLNHLILPIKQPPAGTNLYQWLLLGRRLLVAAIMLGGFLCYLPNADGVRIIDTGFIAFIACVQFLPGILTMLYWPAANSKGFISGLVAGFLAWSVLGLLPWWFDYVLFDISYILPRVINWNLVASTSLLANLSTLVVVSLFTSTSRDERLAARMCSMDSLAQPIKRRLLVNTPGDFIACLSAPLGIETARREVMQSLADLDLNEHETRPYQLQQLRAQTEANLSALLGPTIAHQIMERFLPFSPPAIESSSPDLSFMEQQLESWPVNLSGIALDLDLLRRHHRQVLQNMPLGICALDSQYLISLWNNAMGALTGVSADRITGMPLSALPLPWRALIMDFCQDNATTHVSRLKLTVEGKQYSLSLHKAFVQDPTPGPTKGRRENAGQVIIIEDQTETSILESELAHAERLSSIGRLAAGVAHEIGNPVTGIACLAQNLRDETDDQDLKQMAEQIIQQTRRISSIMHSLVTFSHSGMQADQPSKHEAVCLQALVGEALQLLSLQQDARPVSFENLCSRGILLKTDRQRLLQVLLNLLANARDASEDGSRVIINNGTQDGFTWLAVEDFGCGIPAHIRDRLFEPFFTTKDPGKGTGLGLSLVYRIIMDLGGTIGIHSEDATVGKNGTRVLVSFPCYDPESVPTSP